VTYEATQPIEIPVNVKKIHHSSSKGLNRNGFVSFWFSIRQEEYYTHLRCWLLKQARK